MISQDIAFLYLFILLTPVVYNLKPWDQWSNRELLEFYGNLRIEIETEEY